MNQSLTCCKWGWNVVQRWCSSGGSTIAGEGWCNTKANICCTAYHKQHVTCVARTGMVIISGSHLFPEDFQWMHPPPQWHKRDRWYKRSVCSPQHSHFTSPLLQVLVVQLFRWEGSLGCCFFFFVLFLIFSVWLIGFYLKLFFTFRRISLEPCQLQPLYITLT